MSNIRRQSLISSVIVYIGFALGFLNTYLFTREGGFTKMQYGLTSTFIAVATIMFAVAGMGMHAYIHKFFPYYKDHLPEKKNDQLTWALSISTFGFVFVFLLAMIFDGTVKKIFANQPLFISYYYWMFPFGFGLTVYSILEAWGWQRNRSVLTNYLREVQFRVFVTIFIFLLTTGIISSFDVFIKLYSFIFLALAVILFIILVIKKEIHFTLSVSKVTRRFLRKILVLVMFIWSGGLIFNLSYVFDTIILTAVLPDGLAIAGIFTLGQYMTSLIQAPQRGIVAASTAPLSRAWKEKDMGRIMRIYERSSINQLLFSSAMFLLIWMNFTDAVNTLNLQPEYHAAKNVFLFMGIMRIIDMGTGVSGQIIGTSTFWRFDFITGLLLLAITLPLNYLLTRQMGLLGPAIANLVAFTVYNLIRYWFLLRRFKMQPFNANSVYALLTAFGCYLICYFLFNDKQGWLWMVLRSTLFLGMFIPLVVWLKLTPDLGPLLKTLRKKIF